MNTGADQADLVSPVRQRLRAAGERIEQLTRELTAERHLRDTAIVEAYEAHVRVDTIAGDAGVSRARVLAIVATT
jgi:hypothetical protein